MLVLMKGQRIEGLTRYYLNTFQTTADSIERISLERMIGHRFIMKAIRIKFVLILK